MNQQVNPEKPTIEQQIAYMETRREGLLLAIELDAEKNPELEVEYELCKAIHENLIAVKIWNAAQTRKPLIADDEFPEPHLEGAGDDYPVIPQGAKEAVFDAETELDYKPEAVKGKPPVHSFYHEQAEMQHRNQKLK